MYHGERGKKKSLVIVTVETVAFVVADNVEREK